MSDISFDLTKDERDIAERLFAMVFTPRVGTVHVTSLRKANSRATKRYEAQAKADESNPRES